jgi:hypothetical protein
MKHLFAMQRIFSFMVGITDNPPETISTVEGAYSLVLTLSLGVSDFVLYTKEFRL